AKASLLIGRRWRQDPDPHFNDLSNLSTEKSDYVAAVRLDMGSTFTLGSRMRLDDNLAVRRIDLDTGLKLSFFEGSARYYKVTQNAQLTEDEGISWTARYKFDKHISAIANQTRNISAKEDIRLSLGLAYQDECSYFALVYERSGGRDRSLGPSESIQFDF